MRDVYLQLDSYDSPAALYLALARVLEAESKGTWRALQITYTPDFLEDDRDALSVIGDRLETDGEYAKRLKKLAKEKAQAAKEEAQKAAHERKLYERLRKKFEKQK